MNRIIQIGNFCQRANRNNPNNGRVYHPNGIAPAINTMGGGNLEPHIIVEYGNNKIPTRDI